MQHSCKKTPCTCRYARTLHVIRGRCACACGGGGGLQDIGCLYRTENISAPVSPVDRPDDIIPNRAAWATEVGVAYESGRGLCVEGDVIGVAALRLKA